jgi:hypothetical protein
MSDNGGWEYLSSLHGTTFVVDERLGLWVKFVVLLVPSTPEVPHGIAYSLTLHNRTGKRLLGFDNAHGVGKREQFDHWHRHGGDAGRKYEFETPNQLLADFWREVDRVIKENQDE